MPELSIATLLVNDVVSGKEPPDVLKILRDYGFTHISPSHKWRETTEFTAQERENLQKGLEVSGLKLLGIHGPHPRIGGKGPHLDPGVENEEHRQLAINRALERLQLTHDLGASSMVYHVPTSETDDAAIDRYVDGLARLEEKARELNVVIAIENHYKADVDKSTFTRCFEKFDADYIGFTFDTGHASKSGNTDWLLANCIDRLKALHLNDNDGIGDLHWLPYDEKGTVNWEAIAQGIARSPYEDPIQLEVKHREEKYPTREEFIKAAAAAAHRIHDRVAELRK